MEELRIGLVGTGAIGRTHIERINNTLRGRKHRLLQVGCREVRHQGLRKGRGHDCVR